MLKILIIYLVILWLYGALKYLQLTIIGKVVIYSIYAKMFLLVILLFLFGFYVMTYNAKLKIYGKSILKYYGIWLFYTIICWATLFYRYEYPPEYLFFSLNVLYFFPFLLLLVIFVRNNEVTRRKKHGWSNNRTWDRAASFITVLAIPVLLLAFAQFITGETFLPIEDDFGYYRVAAVDFAGGRTRAFGIFTSGFALGEFSVYMVALWGAYAVSKKNSTIRRVFASIGVIWGFTVVYGTYTRNSYIQVILCMIALMAVARSKIKASYIKIGMCFSVIAVLLFIAFFISTGFGSIDDSIFDSASMLARLYHWNNLINLVVAEGWEGILFGLGVIQNERFDILAQRFVADNVYLALIAYNGVIGLLLFSLLFLSIISLAIQQARFTKDPIWLACASFLLTVPACGMMAVQLNTPFLILIITWVISPPIKYRKDQTHFDPSTVVVC